MNPAEHHVPTILRSSTGADFLATLPTLTGYTVTNSILIVPFHGKRTHGAMRIDLPQANEDPRAHDQLCSLALGAMSRIEWCDGVVFAVYTDESFPVAFAAHERLVTRLDERFEESGFQVKDAFCVATDGWASWYEPEAPFDGHPLSDIEDSPMSQTATQLRGGRALKSHDAEAELPTPDAETAIRLTLAVDELCGNHTQTNAFGMSVPAELPDAIDFVEGLLQREAADTPVTVLARLVALSLVPARRDEMTLQVAFGRKVGRRARAENDRWHARQARTGESMEQVIRAESETSGGRGRSEASALILGEGAAVPRSARIHRAVALLRHTITHLPVQLRPDLLCMLAWLYWALGSSTAADAHLSTALSIDPEHGMANSLQMLVSSGTIPQWVFTHYNEAAPAPHTPRRRKGAGNASATPSRV